MLWLLLCLLFCVLPVSFRCTGVIWYVHVVTVLWYVAVDSSLMTLEMATGCVSVWVCWLESAGPV